MLRRKKMSEHDFVGLLSVLGIIIPALLFVAYIEYDQKKQREKKS